MIAFMLKAPGSREFLEDTLLSASYLHPCISQLPGPFFAQYLCSDDLCH